MTVRTLIKIVFGLLVLLAVAVGLTSINHPIIPKWLTGAAAHHGKPISATIYANGQVNENIKIYYTDEVNNYILSLAEVDSSGMLKLMNINLDEKWIGRPVRSSKNEYDIIAGHLFQSKTGSHFSPFQDHGTHLNFDPQLRFNDRIIRFNMPPHQFEFDSMRIELP